MTFTKKMMLGATVLSLVLAGCSTMSEVMPGPGGTFSLNATGNSTQTASEVLTDLYKEAEQFCAKKGQRVEVVKKDILPSQPANSRGTGMSLGVGGGSGFSSGFGGGVGISFPVADGNGPQAEMVFRCRNED